MGRRKSPLTLSRMTARHLYRRPVRTLLTTLGVALGVVAIVTFSAIVDGMWGTVDTWIHFDGSDLIVFRGDVAGDIFSVLDEEETAAKLESVPGVADAVGTLWHILPVGTQPFFVAEGLRPETIKRRFPALVEGRYPTADNEVLLGSIARRALNKNVGDGVRIQSKDFQVVGVFQTGVVFSDGAVILPLRSLQQLAAREGRVTAFQLRLDDGIDPDVVTTEIERRHPELVAIGDVEEYHKVDQGLEIMESMVWMVTLAAVVIGSIIIANTMWMSVLERTHQIGLLRALGWSRRRIVSLIMLEAAGVGLLACGLGCALGVALAKLVMTLPVSEQFIEPAFGATTFALALATAGILSVAGAALPAWRAARISPAEALRYE